jgi:hypothetical protein
MDKIDFTKPRVDFRKKRGAMHDRAMVDFTKSRIDFNADPDPEVYKRLDPEVAHALDTLIAPAAQTRTGVNDARNRVIMGAGFGSAAVFAATAAVFWSGFVPETLFASINLTSSWAGAICAILALFCGRVGLIGRARAQRSR